MVVAHGILGWWREVGEMKRSIGGGVILLLAGCWLSHPWMDEAEDGLDGSTRSDRGTSDADARDGSPAEDGREGDEPDGPDSSCWDHDGDGHPSIDCGGDDCDDGDPAIYPGAPDTCGDGLDTNCDGLDPLGDGLLGPRVLLVDTPDSGGNMYTALLWTGREYLFVWRRIGIGNVSLIRLDTGGKVLGEEVPLRTFEYAFDVAWSGSCLGAAWSVGDDGGADVFFQAFDVTGRARTDAGRISDDGLATTDGGVHFGPRIVAADGDFLVVWQEREAPGDGTTVIRLVRLAPDGTRRFAPVEVSRVVSAQGLELAWTGSEAAVLYGVGRSVRWSGLRLQRLDGSGGLVGSVRVVSDDAWYDTQCQLVWTGDEFAAFWNEGGDWPDGMDTVTFSRMDPTGAEILRASLGSSLRGLFPEQRPVVWADRYFGVVWVEHRESGWQLTLRRFGPSGAVHGSSIVVPAASDQTGRLDIAWTGSEYGFIWSEDTEGPGGTSVIKVYFQRATFCET
jgi:hypothetical protein